MTKIECVCGNEQQKKGGLVMRYVYELNDKAIVCVQRHTQSQAKERGFREYYVAEFPLTRCGAVQVQKRKRFFPESFYCIEDAQERLDEEAKKLNLKEWGGEMCLLF